MKIWRKVWVSVIGGFIVLAGLVMLFTPGPGLVTIAVGMALLATEYEWAKRQLKRTQERIIKLRERRK